MAGEGGSGFLRRGLDERLGSFQNPRRCAPQAALALPLRKGAQLDLVTPSGQPAPGSEGNVEQGEAAVPQWRGGGGLFRKKKVIFQREAARTCRLPAGVSSSRRPRECPQQAPFRLCSSSRNPAAPYQAVLKPPLPSSAQNTFQGQERT